MSKKRVDANKNSEIKVEPVKYLNERNLRPKKSCNKVKQCKCYECTFIAKIAKNQVDSKKHTDRLGTHGYVGNQINSSGDGTTSIHKPNPKFKCNTCNYVTESQTSFVAHQEIHLIVKGYKCDKCNFRTALRYDLLVHQRKHAGSAYKKFRCRYCLYYTDSRKAILQHQAKMHKCGKVNDENQNAMKMVHKLFRPCFVRLRRLTREEIELYQLNIPGDDFSKLPLTLRRRQSLSSSSSSDSASTDDEIQNMAVRRQNIGRNTKSKRSKNKLVKTKTESKPDGQKDGTSSSSSSESESESESSSTDSTSSERNQCDFYSDFKKAMVMSNLLVNRKGKASKQLNGMVILTVPLPKKVTLKKSSIDSSSDEDSTRVFGAIPRQVAPSSISKGVAQPNLKSKNFRSTSKTATPPSSISKTANGSAVPIEITNLRPLLTHTATLSSVPQATTCSLTSKRVLARSSISREITQFGGILQNTPLFGSLTEEASQPGSISKRKRRRDSPSQDIGGQLISHHKIKRETESPDLIADNFLEIEYLSAHSPEYIVGADLGDLDDPFSNNAETITANEIEANEPICLLQPKTELELRPNTIYQLQVIKKEPLDY